MSSLGAQTRYTPEEYFFSERKATLKNEYLSGEMLAMSGASLVHTCITLFHKIKSTSNTITFKVHGGI